MQKALFLDRDGVIVREVRGAAAQDPAELELMPKAVELLLKAKQGGFLLILVSNQPDYALGKISLETRSAIELAFISLLRENGLKLDAVYYCYHHPLAIVPDLKVECRCRKPGSEMLRQAITSFNVDATTSFFLGDRASDVKAGLDVGLMTILVDPNHKQTPYLELHDVRPNYTIKDLSEAIKVLDNSGLKSV